MAKQAKLTCARCEARLDDGSFCPSCGYPTPWATHDERVEYELRQWSSHQDTRVAPGRQVAHAAKGRDRRWFRSRRPAEASATPPAPPAPAPRTRKRVVAQPEPEVIVSAAELREAQAGQRRQEPAADREASPVSELRAARRLPSVADIEEIAKEGPPMIKILRLINARISLLDTQTEDESRAARR